MMPNVWNFVALERMLIDIIGEIAPKIEPGYQSDESQLAWMVREYLGF